MLVVYDDLIRLTINMSILFVEDHVPFREEMGEMLEELFYESVTVSNGKEALEYYHKYRNENSRDFDIVLSDIRMPKLDGVQLCKEIKSTNPSQNIIIVSAYTEPHDMIELINLGVTRFLQKPVQYEHICNAFAEIGKEKLKQKTFLQEDHPIIDLGKGFSWNSRLKKLFYKDIEIRCTKYEQMLIDCLINTKGMICSLENILEYFYSQGVDLTPKSIRNVIMKIRQKTYKDLVRNLYGLGYGLSTEEL